MNNILEARLDLPFTEAIELIKEELAKNGFGIITEINVTETLKKKLDIDFKQYQILGACNPGFAHKAIEMSDNVGLLLPCNVIVYTEGDGVIVKSMRPTFMLNILDSSEVCQVGALAEEALESTFDSLSN